MEVGPPPPILVRCAVSAKLDRVPLRECCKARPGDFYRWLPSVPGDRLRQYGLLLEQGRYFFGKQTDRVEHLLRWYGSANVGLYYHP